MLMWSPLRGRIVGNKKGGYRHLLIIIVSYLA